MARPSRSSVTRDDTLNTSSSSAEMNTTDIPFSDSSPTSRCTSTLAPMSIPRVGSSSTITRGASARSRASSTFCWLPPDSTPARWSAEAGRMPSASIQLVASSRCLAWLIRWKMPRWAWRASVMFSPHRQLTDDALGPAVLRRVGEAHADSAVRISRGDRGTVEQDDAVVGMIDARSAGGPPRCAPEPSSPAMPSTSPSAMHDRDVAHARRTEAAGLEDRGLVGQRRVRARARPAGLRSPARASSARGRFAAVRG